MHTHVHVRPGTQHESNAISKPANFRLALGEVSGFGGNTALHVSIDHTLITTWQRRWGHQVETDSEPLYPFSTNSLEAKEAVRHLLFFSSDNLTTSAPSQMG